MFNFKRKNTSNKVKKEDKIQRKIVNLLFNYLVIFSAIILIFITFKFSSQDQKELIVLMWNSQIHLVNIAVGYYFGDRK